MALDGSDLWQSLVLAANDSATTSITVQLTMCMVAFEAQDMEIQAIRPTPVTPEPELIWNTYRAIYDTGTVLRQLGADGSRVSIEERGISKLEPRSWKWPQRPKYIGITSGTFSSTSDLEAAWFNDKGIYSGMVNEAQHSILGHMASSTANPALALQA